MKTNQKPTVFFLKLFYIILFFCAVFIINGCASSSEMKVSEFNFSYEGNDYAIRSSYCPDNPQSCNQLIGRDFIASDLNQDRIIDKVIKGNIPLSKAQEIYDYCLSSLEKQGKVNKIDIKDNIYSFAEGKFIYELKTFMVDSNNYFNQFTVKEKAGFSDFNITLFLDKNANGTLDETLKGDFIISIAQTKYNALIDKGLKDNKISIVNGFIIINQVL